MNPLGTSLFSEGHHGKPAVEDRLEALGQYLG